MTDEIFKGFLQLEERFGTEGAIAGLAIEGHTVSRVIDILRDNESEAHVDLVQGGRTILLFTEEKHERAQQNFAAAKDAGINVDRVEWLTKEQVEKASLPLYIPR